MEYGAYGRVLFCGQLEKRRDGAVRGGWSSRLFILTPHSLHYFRKAVEGELLGEERGHLALKSIKCVRARTEDEVPESAVESNAEHYYLEIITKDNRYFLMRTPLRLASTCESWSIAIEEQRKVLLNKKKNRKTNDQNISLALVQDDAGSRDTSDDDAYESLVSPTLLASNHELYSLFQNTPPRIALVSVIESSSKPRERVVRRKVAWGDTLDLGVLAPGGACIILLQTGGVGRVGVQALTSAWDANHSTWIDVHETTHTTQIQVSVSCQVLSKKTSNKGLLGALRKEKKDDKEIEDKWLSMVGTCTSAGFLVLCLFVHLIYGVDGFHWLHKCCLTVGAALAITTLLHGNTQSPTQSLPSPTSLSSSGTLPTLDFHLTLHRCRVQSGDTSHEYPSNLSAKKVTSCHIAAMENLSSYMQSEIERYEDYMISSYLCKG